MAVALDEIRERHAAELERRLVDSLDERRLADVAARYHLATGGKRLRALLPIWLCTNLGGPADDALDFGVGLELLHNATLVHDDLQDGDTHRRGVPAVWVRWGAPQAINVGNAMFFHGLQRIARARRATALMPAVYAAMLRVIEGQALEFQLQRPSSDPDHVPTSLAAWMEMARAKTAALFATCLRAGAVAAGEGGGRCDAADRFGERVGLLFQVQDDLLDLVGDKGRGQRATDLAEGKVSYPVAWTVEHAGRAQVERLIAIVQTPRLETTPAMVDEALILLHETGAVDATVDFVREEARAIAADAFAEHLPGLVDRVLEPVRHVL